MPAPATQTAQPLVNLTAIYSLADHLDATLAMGEDLLKQAIDVAPLTPGDQNAVIEQRQRMISGFARRIRALELGMTARLLQARARAVEVRDAHPKFAPMIGLFVGGTAPLVEAAAGGLGDISQQALVGGPAVLAFLKSRALADAELQSLGGVNQLRVTEGYLLAEHIHFGTLLDMIAAFSDALDVAFDLYAAPKVVETA